jgi:hypothetical protein
MRTIYYYILILAPIPFVLIWNFDALMLIILLFLYVFIYRPIVDFFKLKSMGLLSNNKFKYFFIPFYRYKWVKYLYF